MSSACACSGGMTTSAWPRFLGGQQGDEGGLQRAACRSAPAVRRAAGGQYLAIVHGHQPVEALGFVHVGGGHQHAHAGAGGADAGDQVPELGAGQRVDAGGRARPGSAGRGRGSGRSTGRAFASCRRRACPPGGPGMCAARWPGSGRRCGGGARQRRGRTGGRRIAGFPPPTGWGTGSCPAPAACRPRAGRTALRWRRWRHVAAQHLTWPCWMMRAPAISASRLDLPTPSGPIRPTMRPAGMSSVMPARACVSP